MTEMEIASGSGSYLTSADDERYLDFTSGIGVTNTGHCHPRVVAAAQEQLAKLLHGQVSVGLSAPLVALTNRMIDGVVPDSHDRVMFSTTGAEAVENAVRLVRATTGRPNLIVFQGGYHGRTIGTLALTRSKTSYGAANHPQMPGVFVAPFPYASQAPGVDSDAALNQVRWLPPLPRGSLYASTGAAAYRPLPPAAQLELLLKQQTAPSDTAAVIIEPVLGEGGYVGRGLAPTPTRLGGCRTPTVSGGSAADAHPAHRCLHPRLTRSDSGTGARAAGVPGGPPTAVRRARAAAGLRRGAEAATEPYPGRSKGGYLALPRP